MLRAPLAEHDLGFCANLRRNGHQRSVSDSLTPVSWRVAPLQKQLLRMSEGDLDWDAYRSRSRQWEWWGLFATILPAAAVVLMTWKPVL